MTLGLGAGSVQSPNFFHAGLGELGPEGRSREFPSRIRGRAYSSVQMHKRYVDLQAADVEEAKKDSALSWLQSARTNVVHREALIPGSTLELRCIGDPRHPHGEDDDDPKVWIVSPFQCTHYYIHAAPFIDHAHEFERRWSMEGLEGRELLEVCADCFDRLDDLVHFAHQQLGAPMVSSRREGSLRSLPCMEDTTPHRVARTVMRDGQEVWVNEPPGLHNQ